MKRILLAIVSSAALLATATGAAHAATQAASQNNASTCQGPASYCNVFFGQ
ncbi:hypothetical protein [Paraburkholderia kururiensis]|jgi:opacity protein-like surface antigen|uniref:Uncharacterized protein n=1 Tax=Paraburkholderia kururiensis TaxID=984307 RepID=A0ABZ0WN55_9BURK|nr:hypothetical protein [Paraburkholderia kururiensis]WQD78803.1 hypothetical protein U0042_03580 [Paraburkholderia kururiensis]